jgi:hypothetical protein
MGGLLCARGADADRAKGTARRVATFTAGVMGLVCSTSAALALSSQSTASEMEHMLRLPFRVTQPMVVGLIVFGGVGICFSQWLVTYMSVLRTTRFFSPQTNHVLGGR